jgi:hypothetical protein
LACHYNESNLAQSRPGDVAYGRGLASRLWVPYPHCKIKIKETFDGTAVFQNQL